jgi:hypothetical protein
MTDLEADRRSTPRHLACGLAFVDREDGTPRRALIADISKTGARLFTRANLSPDETIRVSLHLLADRPPVEVEARVVRRTERPPALAEVWRFDAAIAFSAPLPIDEAVLAEVAQRQADARSNS